MAAKLLSTVATRGHFEDASLESGPNISAVPSLNLGNLKVLVQLWVFYVDVTFLSDSDSSSE